MPKQRIVPFKPTLSSLPEQISHYFQFEQLGTNYRTEWLASLTTFMALAPILVVNAHILGNAVFLQQPGDLFEQILVAQALCSALASILIGVLANYPFALGAGTDTTALSVDRKVLRSPRWETSKHRCTHQHKSSSTQSFITE